MKEISGASSVDVISTKNNDASYSLSLNLKWVNKYISKSDVQQYLISLEQNKTKIANSPNFIVNVNANAEIKCS